MSRYRRGSVVLVRLDPVVGYLEKIASYPVCVPVDAGVAGLRRRSIVNCAHVRTGDATRLSPSPLGDLPDARMREIDAALRIHLGL